jgi:hypothetical protein
MAGRHQQAASDYRGAANRSRESGADRATAERLDDRAALHEALAARQAPDPDPFG